MLRIISKIIGKVEKLAKKMKKVFYVIKVNVGVYKCQILKIIKQV